MKIYVITHKTFKFDLKENIYVPILVGADYNVGENYYLKDNNGDDNISYKNKNYCELTGMYWIWKYSNEDIIGICHYRRYFTNRRYIFPNKSYLSEEDIYNLLSQYDIILPKKGFEYRLVPAKEQFALLHDLEIWEKCKIVIQKKYPDYLQAFEWFEKQTSGYCYNMMIVRKEKYNKYCLWLFNILFELEKKIDISKYAGYEERIFGFLSERLINVWIHHENLKVCEKNIFMTEESILSKLKVDGNLFLSKIIKNYHNP